MNRFRDFVAEGKITGKFSISGTPVLSVSSWVDLQAMLHRSEYNELRGMLQDNKLVVWDAAHHTHRDYQMEFEFAGIQIVFEWNPSDNRLLILHQGDDNDRIKKKKIIQRIVDQFRRMKQGDVEVTYLY